MREVRIPMVNALRSRVRGTFASLNVVPLVQIQALQRELSTVADIYRLSKRQLAC
jgi:hypothetical protein